MKAKVYANNSVDAQNAIDNNRTILLKADPEFISDIEEVRTKFHIPTHLEPTSDAHIGRLLLLNYKDNDDLFSGVFTHELLNSENRDRFRKAIMKIIRKYKLGMNFFTWIQWYVLYGEPTMDPVDPDFNFYKRLKTSLEELFRLPKTTAQKKEIKEWFRSVHKFPATGRIPKEHTDYYNYFVSILDRKKPNVRRPKTDHSIDFNILERHGKHEPLDNKIIKNTYLSLVADLLPLAPKEEDLLSAQKLRKRKERLKTKINKVKN